MNYFPEPNQSDMESPMAQYAMRASESRGRRHPESDHPYRTVYQRDRDRIIHSTAFRRLMYKTQVMVSEYSDHHRTRLTHTLEVAQISRTIARCLGLNEDLTEAVALAHDLGHPPFGHAGEEALAECMNSQGGFEHNRQGLRIVEKLEYRYSDFPGLNLSWEVLESMAHRCKNRESPEVSKFPDTGCPLLEAQVVDAADSLTYNAHDLDDALSVGLIDIQSVLDIEFCKRTAQRLGEIHGPLGTVHFQPALIRGLIDWQVGDLLENSRKNLADYGVGSVDDVKNSADVLIAPGAEVVALKNELEAFLHAHVYSHYLVVRMTTKAQRSLVEMFNEYCRVPNQLPDKYEDRVARWGVPQTVCDYLAGMTDRYALAEHRKLFSI